MNSLLLVKIQRFSSHEKYVFTLKSFFIFSLVIFSFTNVVFGQKSTWRYVTTIPGGTKGYLNDEIKNIDNGNKNAWEKMINTDGSFAIALAEWDCQKKRRLTKQISFYGIDQAIIGTTKKQYEWAEIIPGSVSDFMFTRVCLPPQEPKIAEIIVLKANLRTFPDISAPTIREVSQGDKFQIIPETGKGGWYNVVDNKTQQDYWLHGNTFKIVNEVPIKKKTEKKNLSKKIKQKRN